MLRGLSSHEIDNVVSQIIAVDAPAEDGELADRGVINVRGDISPESFRLFESANDDFQMAAVDGGSATLLNAGSFVVASVRVGQAMFRESEFQREHSSNPELHVFHISLGSLREAYSIFYEKTVGGTPPDTPKGLEEAVGRIRTLLEWNRVEVMLEDGLAPGSVLVFDGALWAGITGIGPMLQRIVKGAAENGIILCGISKKSMLTHSGQPLIPKVQMLGEEFHPKRAWFLPLDIDTAYSEKQFGEVFVAKLHPYSGHVFRTDLALPNGIDGTEALGKLAALSNDPTYAGYPYPLARVHNDVAFTRSEVEELRHLLRKRALDKGMDQKSWHLTFQEFHDVLDINR
jgi:hypothetical protein